MDMYDEARTLCASSAYSEKFYFNESRFQLLPNEVKKELEIISILFTQDAGGELVMYFDNEGSLILKTNAAETDAYYDDINAGLLLRRIMDTRKELFLQLEMFYGLLSEGKFKQ